MTGRDLHELGYQMAGMLAEGAAASEILTLVREAGRASAAIITLPAPQTGRPQDVAAVQGYDATLVREIAAAHFPVHDPAYRVIRSDPDRPWRCWWNLDFDYAATVLGREHLVPAGFRGGASLRIETPFGRHVGDLHLSTEERRHPSPEAMRVLQETRRVLAHLCVTADPGDGEPAAVRVWPDGAVDCLRPAPEAPWAAAFQDMARRNAALALSAGPALVRRWHSPDGTWHRVVLRSLRRAAVVETRPEPIPFGLTPRELEVLEGLTDGLANFSIARRLGLSERTVAHIVERILGKLDVASRAGAAARAERDGLISVI